MADTQEIFIDVPIGKMSQTAKRYCSLDVEKQESDYIHSPPKTNINNHLSYQVGTVGRAIRCPHEPQKCTPYSKSADLDIFQNKDIFSILPFESLPHPQKLRKKSSRKVIKPIHRDFNKNFLVDNHLRQLKKRHAYNGSYETDCEQPFDECSRAVDISIPSSEDINNRYIEKFGVSLNKIPHTCSTIFSETMFENGQLHGRQQLKTFASDESDATQMMETYQDFQLRSDFLVPQYWQPFSNSTPLKEE